MKRIATILFLLLASTASADPVVTAPAADALAVVHLRRGGPAERPGQPHWTAILVSHMRPSAKGDTAEYTVALPGEDVGNDVTEYAWDATNRLRSATLSVWGSMGKTAAFTYAKDMGWQIASQTVDNETRAFSWGYGGELLSETVPNVGTRSYINAGIDQVLWSVDSSAGVPAGGANFWLNDANGSVYGITDQAGSIIQRQRYDAFGKTEVTQASAAFGNRVGFQGRDEIAGFGIQNLRNRFYDPSVGRFLSRDPLGLVDGPAVYAFCAGEPVNRTDPMGLCWDNDGNWDAECGVPGHEKGPGFWDYVGWGLRFNSGLAKSARIPTRTEQAKTANDAAAFMRSGAHTYVEMNTLPQPPGPSAGDMRPPTAAEMVAGRRWLDEQLYGLSTEGQAQFAQQVYADATSGDPTREGRATTILIYSIGATAFGAAMEARPPAIREAPALAVEWRTVRLPDGKVVTFDFNDIRTWPEMAAAGEKPPKIPPGSAGGEGAGKPIPKSLRDEFFSRGQKKCSYCGEGRGTDLDHVVPKVANGDLTPENITPACPHCNRSKGARPAPVTPLRVSVAIGRRRGGRST